MAAQARWLGDDTKAPSTADAPAPPPPPAAATPDATSKRISARIERYAVNGGAPTYFVRAEQDGAERTLSVKFEQFRALHKKLQDDGGVLYGTADRFPKVTRKARLGLRMSPTEISEQCELLNGWLRETVASIGDLPLSLQSETRRFLALEGEAPPAWRTAKSTTGVGGMLESALQRAKERSRKPNAVYPLGDSASLPGVTRRGRLECRDGASGAWVQTHVILTHLSLLVFQPLDEPGSARAGQKGQPPGPLGLLNTLTQPRQNSDPASSPNSGKAVPSAAAALAATAASPNAHPAAAAAAAGVRGDDPASAAASGKLLHNLHVTDILSILRHGDAESFAPPLHHRCFTIGDLNDVSICLRAVNARDCLGWLKAIARAKDRALAAVHRLDDKAHGHDLVLATATAASNPRRPDPDDGVLAAAAPEPRIVARGSPRFGYGWCEPVKVEVEDATLALELNAGDVELDVVALVGRAAADQAQGLGAAASVGDAHAAVSGGARGAFWCEVAEKEDASESRDDGAESKVETLDILVAIDATAAFEAARDDATLPEWASWAIATALDVAQGFGDVFVDSPAAFLKTSVLGGAPGTVSQQTLEHVVGAVVFGVLAYVAKACFLGDSIRLVYDGDDHAWQLRASLGAILLLSVAALSVRSALAAAADEALAAPRPDGERVPPAALAAVAAAKRARKRGRKLTLDLRLVDWRWRDGSKTRPAVVRSASRRAEKLKEAAAAAEIPAPRDELSKPPRAGLEDAGASSENEVADALPRDVPKRFLGAVRGDPAQALKRWKETEAWRADGNRPEDVQYSPQPHFDVIKASHTHFFHRRDKLGHLCAYEVIENPNRAFKAMERRGIGMADVVAHMHFVSAWTYATLLDDVDEVGRAPKDPEGYFLKIIDCKSIGLGDCGGATAAYFKAINAINRNYPERVWRTIIINAPSIFGVIWSIVSPLLDPNVREKITVLRGNYEATLRELVDEDQLPVAYGGTDASVSPEELALKQFVLDHCTPKRGDSAASLASLDAAGDSSGSLADLAGP